METKGYEILIKLDHIEPEIWRRFLISSGESLGRLHTAIQLVMDWSNTHLHIFVHGDETYRPAEDDEDAVELEEGERDESQYTVGDLLSQKGDVLEYVYDLGDDWKHILVLEEIRDSAPEIPVCLGGARACPPEDVGGAWGYNDFLDAIRHPEHPGHEDMFEWVGGNFDPEAFDLDEKNKFIQEEWKK